ncbi:MAG TPA: hypothetical protein PLI18_03955 [Pirellulaceae bacterium]|nr:hypothetical protein [Pirellulaceae bacterium]
MERKADRAGMSTGGRTLVPVLAGIVVSFFAFAVSSPLEARQRPRADRLLPPDTLAFVSVPDMQSMVTGFEATDLGALAADERCRPFFDDLKRQLEERLAGRLAEGGLTLDDLKGVRTGEIGLALLPIENGAGSILVVDVDGRQAEARELLGRIVADLERRAARENPPQQRFGATVRSFTLKPRPGQIRLPQIQLVEHAGWIVVGSDPVATDQVLRRMAGEAGIGSLAEQPAYARIDQRLGTTRTDAAAHLRWHIDPFRLAAAIKREQSIPAPIFKYLDAMAETGFAEIAGIGGDLRFASGAFDVEYQTFAVVPGAAGLEASLLQSARMLPLVPSDEQIAPSAYVSGAAASMIAGNWPFAQTIGAADPLVDRVTNKEGAFAKILNDFRIQADRPIDFRLLAAEIGPGFTFSTEIVPPLTADGEKLLLSTRVARPERVLEHLSNLMAVEGYEPEPMVGASIAWKYVPPDQVDDPVGNILEGNTGETPPNPEKPPLMEAFALVDGELLASNDAAYLAEVIARRGNAPLVADPDFADVMILIGDRLPGGATLVRYGRPDRIYRLTYELMRRNELTGSDTFVERMLRLIDGTETGTVRRQQIQATSLPEDFDAVVAPRLHPSGWALSVEQDGWFVTGGILAPKR